MLQRKPLRHKSVALTLGLVCGLSATAGCYAPFLRTSGIRAARTVAVVTAARASHLHMFGDVPYTNTPTYQPRNMISLRKHTFTEVGSDFDITFDASGKRMVFASTRHSTEPDLYYKSINGVAVTQLTADPASDIQPALSPDGQRVAFASFRSGSWDIWVLGIKGGRPVQITTGPTEDVHPSWSPDGSQLVYCSLPANGGPWELWTADVYTQGPKRFIGYGLFPEWSPVGNQIVFQRARERGSQWFSIWVITLVDGEPSYPTELASGAAEAMVLPSWSPDGKRIAYAGSSAAVARLRGGMDGETSAVMDIWQMSADGRDKVRLTDGTSTSYAPSYSATGRVFFTSNRAGNENLWSVIPPFIPLNGAPQKALTSNPQEPGVVRTALP